APADQLAAIVRAHVRSHCEFPLLGVVSNHEMHNLSAEAVAPSLALPRRAEDLLWEGLDRGQRDGVVDLALRRAARAALASMGVSVAQWYPSRRDQTAPAELADEFAALALRMVGARA